MKPNVRLRLIDILESIKGIETTIAGKDFAAYRETWPVKRAVERGLEIISESSRHIPDSLKALAPDVPWPQIAGIGNILRHEYHRVDDLAVWNITREHLPCLMGGVQKILKHIDQHKGS